MRTIISAFAVALTCTFTLTACSGADSESSTKTAKESADKGSSEAKKGELTGSGTAEDPYSIGNTHSADKIDIALNGFTADGTDKVLKFNAASGMSTSELEPDADNGYALANITVKQKDENILSSLDFKFAFVTDDGQEHGVENQKMLMIPEPAQLDGLQQGKSTTGNVIIEIPQKRDGMLRIKTGPFESDEVYFLTK